MLQFIIEVQERQAAAADPQTQNSTESTTQNSTESAKQNDADSKTAPESDREKRRFLDRLTKNKGKENQLRSATY